MAQRMRGDGLCDASRHSLPFDHDQNHRAGKVTPVAIQEYIVFLSRLDLHQLTVIKPESKLLDGFLGDGNEALFASFSQYTNELFVEIEV